MQNRLSSYGVLFVILCRTDLSADIRRNGTLLTASDVRDGNIRGTHIQVRTIKLGSYMY